MALPPDMYHSSVVYIDVSVQHVQHVAQTVIDVNAPNVWHDYNNNNNFLCPLVLHSGLENMVIISKISRISDIFDIYIYLAFAHTLLKLYEIYYQIIVCVCALHIRWSALVIHTALLWRGAIWQKLSNTEKMLRAQVISQQNTWTENQNVVTMCHIKKYF